MQDDPPDMGAISAKLDRLLALDDRHIFDDREVKVLQDMIGAWQAASGFVTITKTVGVVLAFIVIFITQKDRLMELLHWGKP